MLTSAFRDQKKRNFHPEDLWNAIVVRDHLMAIEVIKSMQINLNAKDKDDCDSSALHMAAETGQDLIVIALIKFGAKVDVVNRLEDTPLMLAAARGHESTCSILLENKSKVGARDQD